MNFKTPDGNEYPEYAKFERYVTPFVTWIPLLVGENRVRFFALSNLREVVDPRLTGMIYTCELPPRTLTIWRPTIEVPITQLGYYREGSKQKAIPGLNLTMCNVRIVLTLPEAA